MIHLTRPELTCAHITRLDEYQETTNLEPDYPKRVQKAKTAFKSANRKGNITFDAIKQALLSMCCGGTRCHYCEDSAPDEIEHFKPKDLYPETCFVWANYLYVCGPCNGTYKNNRFSVQTTSGDIVDITRQRGDAVTSPLVGEPVLIDPSHENPLDFMELDLATFIFNELGDENTHRFERARFTIETLGLNARDILVESRRSAFASYFARLKQYTDEKMGGASSEKLERLKCGIFSMPHITVWAEMQRQRTYNSERHRQLKEMFDLSSELHTASL